MHTVQVLGGGGAGTGTHVRSLTAGLVARGVRVTVCAPRSAERRHGFTRAGAEFVPLPDRAEPGTFAGLRAVCRSAELVHAHGLRATLLALAALGGRPRSVPLVVSWHRRAEPEGIRAPLMGLLERWALREAAVVLGASPQLVDRARRRGARDARLAPVAVPAPRSAVHDRPGAAGELQRLKTRAELGTIGRQMLLAVGRLTPDQGYGTLLTASRAWSRLEPQPLLAIAGEGPERAALQRRIDGERLPVRLLGRRDDALDLLAAADAAVFTGRRAVRSLLAQEALRAGVPLVTTAVGGIPELVGDAALLVPYGDADALAAAVAVLLRDPVRGAELAAAGRMRAAFWPTEDHTVAQVLSVYDELAAQR